MLDIFLQLNLLRKLVEVSVNPGTHVATFSRLLQKLDVLTLAPPHHRCQKLDLGAFRKL